MAGQTLDQAAQRMGFKDFATFQAYQAHRQQVLQNPRVEPGTADPQQSQQSAPSNWLQMIPGHPAMIFNYINKRLGSVMGGN